MALIGYARVSTAAQNKDLQVTALKTAGCAPADIKEETASGAKTDRPVLAKLLKSMKTGDVLVVWRLDRLGRSMKHLIDVVTSLEERGIGFKSVHDNIDTTTSGGKLMFHIFASLSEFERSLIIDRTTAGLVESRAQGRMAGARSFGWAMTPDGRLSGEHNEEEAAHLREAAQQIIKGGSPFRIAQEWNERGIRTTKGGPWTHSNLRLALLNPKMAGFRVHNGEVVNGPDGNPIQGQWKPILSVEDWEKVCAVINAKKRQRAGSTRHLLGGLLTCHCGGTMYGSVGKDYRSGRPVINYTCGVCRTAIGAAKAESSVLSAVASALVISDTTSNEPDCAHEPFVARLRALQKQDDRIKALAIEGVYSVTETAAERAAINAEREAIQQEIQQATATATIEAQVLQIRRELWSSSKVAFLDAVKAKQAVYAAIDALDFDRQRALIRGTVEATVLKGRSDDRVKVWHLVALDLNEADAA